MAIRLVSHGTLVATSPSPPINTLGAQLIVMVLACGAGTIAIPTDNQGNVYSALTIWVGQAGSNLAMYYRLNPATSPTHTFSTPSAVPAMCMAAFTCAGSFNQQSGANAPGTPVPVQPGALTPPSNGALFVTGVSSASTSWAVDSGFTILDQCPVAGGVNWGAALAYRIQVTAAALNPQWSSVGGGLDQTNMATFLALPGCGGYPPRSLTLGGGVNA